jgi:hypothetical protein
MSSPDHDDDHKIASVGDDNISSDLNLGFCYISSQSLEASSSFHTFSIISVQ